MAESTGKHREATRAGNYFISNYPPYSFWKPEFVPKALEALDRPPRAGNPLGLYVHIPFCRKRCHFCLLQGLYRKEVQGNPGIPRRCNRRARHLYAA